MRGVLYFTTVRVTRERALEWEAFYDDHARAFVSQVPGCERGTRWRATAASVDGAPIPEDGAPLFQAIFEHPRLDAFIASRQYRSASEDWRPRARSFGRWYASLSDYATIHLHPLFAPIDADCGSAPPALLTCVWSVAWEDAEAFGAVYRREVEGDLTRSLPGLVRVDRYLAMLAQLHRYGDESGTLVIPQRHHFEDRTTRLVYATIHVLEGPPPLERQRAYLAELGSWMGRHRAVVADRIDAFVERRLVA